MERTLFWSPDGRFLAFLAGGKLKKIAIAGGPAVSLCDAGQGFGGSWSTGDVIVFSSGWTGGLSRVSAAGGSATEITVPDKQAGELSHRYPWFLPDGRHYLYTAVNTDPGKSGLYFVDLETKTRHLVLAANSNAAYVPPGNLLFQRE